MPIGAFLKAALPVVGNVIGNLVGAGIQSHSNMKLAKYQNAYNTPAAQMKRYKDAGLNPNLVYTQGNSGNMSPITPTNWQGALSNVGSQYNQSELQQTQSDVGRQKISESEAKKSLMAAQEDVHRANPLLDPEYLGYLVQSGIATFKSKEQDANYLLSSNPDAQTVGQQKIAMDVQALAQRIGLNEADKNMKAEILKSQQFKTELLEVQRNWLKNADVTPQHILNGLMLLLSKFM